MSVWKFRYTTYKYPYKRGVYADHIIFIKCITLFQDFCFDIYKNNMLVSVGVKYKNEKSTHLNGRNFYGMPTFFCANIWVIYLFVGQLAKW